MAISSARVGVIATSLLLALVPASAQADGVLGAVTRSVGGVVTTVAPPTAPVVAAVVPPGPAPTSTATTPQTPVAAVTGAVATTVRSTVAAVDNTTAVLTQGVGATVASATPVVQGTVAATTKVVTSAVPTPAVTRQKPTITPVVVNRPPSTPARVPTTSTRAIAQDAPTPSNPTVVAPVGTATATPLANAPKAPARVHVRKIDALQAKPASHVRAQRTSKRTSITPTSRAPRPPVFTTPGPSRRTYVAHASRPTVEDTAVAAGGRLAAPAPTASGVGFDSPVGRFSVSTSGVLLGGSADGTASVRLVAPASLVALAALVGIVAVLGQRRYEQRRRVLR